MWNKITNFSFASMISIILIAISGMCFAVADSLGVLFYDSIFYRIICWKSQHREQWWNSSISWKNKYRNGLVYRGRKSFRLFSVKFPIPSLFFSAFDLFNTIHIITMLLSISLYTTIVSPFYVDFIILLLIWNSSFIFFKSIFVK